MSGLETSEFVPLEIPLHTLFHHHGVLEETSIPESEAARYPVLSVRWFRWKNNYRVGNFFVDSFGSVLRFAMGGWEVASFPGDIEGGVGEWGLNILLLVRISAVVRGELHGRE
jgi:hypothetical protein